jgi:hypothetical protein
MKPFAEMSFAELFVAAIRGETVLEHPVENLGGLEVQFSNRGMTDSIPSLPDGRPSVGSQDNAFSHESIQNGAGDDAASHRAA